jgi:single-strand DNA-binding protein
MSGSVNKVLIIGNVGKDPEIRSMGNGARVATLSVATSESWRDRASGERKEKTEWNRIAIFNDRLVEIAEKYVRKGSKVYVEGSLQTRKWVDKDGQDRYMTEVVLGKFNGQLTLLDGKSNSGDADEPAPRQQQSRGGGQSLADDLSDEIPFISCAQDEDFLFSKRRVL